MQKFLNDYLEGLNKKREKRRKARIAKLLLVVLVIGTVAGVLSQYGVAMTDVEKCGLAEHKHNGACYENTLVCGMKETEGHHHTDECYTTESILSCGLEETEGHQHDESCYDEEGNLICGMEESEGHHHTDGCYTQERTLACGQEEGEEHTHTDACYEQKLICGMEEHTHTEECYIDKGVDVEEPSKWDDMYANTAWMDTWNENLVIAAKKQLAYRESRDNYEVAEDGSHKGYTRYGAFCEDAYCDWDAAFVNFCMHYAGEDDVNIEASEMFPAETDTEKWREEFLKADEDNESFLAKPEDYEPKAGDLVFFDGETEEAPLRMGIVSSYDIETYDSAAYDTETAEIKVIEGNSDDEVKENRYPADDSRITGYLKLAEAEKAYRESEARKRAVTEEKNWAYEESYDAGQVIIHVMAEEGIVPEGAELSVTPIEQKEVTEDMTAEEAAEAETINEKYELTNQKLEEESQKKDAKLEGFLAYDICFIVDGEEVEPSGEVKVTMDFKEAVVPETVSEDATITVSHLKEMENGEIEVEDLTGKDAAVVEMTEESASVEKVELVADSFSVFSISWKVENDPDDWKRFGIKVHRVDNTGAELEYSEKPDFFNSVTLGQKYNLENQLGGEVISVGETSYELYKIEAVEVDLREPGTIYKEVEEIEFVGTYPGVINFYKEGQQVATYDGLNDAGKVHLQMVYRPVVLRDIEIENDIEKTGNLKVLLRGSALNAYNAAVATSGSSIEYRWFKSVNGATYSAVQRKGFAVTDGAFNGTSNIIGDYGEFLNVALDEGSLVEDERDSVKYKVELWINGVMIAGSDAQSIPYYDEVINGSFEKPAFNSSSPQYEDKIPQQGVPGWNTTAVTGHIEIASVGLRDGVMKIHQTYYTRGQNEPAIPEYEFSVTGGGIQFAELNADAVGSLYQDILVAKGTVMNYSFYHRARCRKPNDDWNTMYLVIVPTKVAKDGILDSNFERDATDSTKEIDTQKEVKYLIEYLKNVKEGESLYPGAYVKTCKAHIGDWTKNEGTYIPEYDLNRFYFVSAETYYTTEGNFLDNVWFSQDLPEPVDNAFSFQLTKKISGIKSIEEASAVTGSIKFNITAVARDPKDGKEYNVSSLFGDVVTGGAMQWNSSADGKTYTGVYKKQDFDMGIYDQYEITVEEVESSVKVDSYSVTTSGIRKLTEVLESTDIETGGKVLAEKSTGTTSSSIKFSGFKTGKINLKEGSTAEVTYNNDYSKDNGLDLTIKKLSFSDKATALSDAAFSLTKQGGDSTEVLTGKSDKDGIVTWEKDGKPCTIGALNLNGTYILKETTPPEGYLAIDHAGDWTLEFKNGKLCNADTLKTAIKDQTDIIKFEENSTSKTCTISIYNKRIYTLPSAGGPGIYLYMFGGVLLMLAAPLLAYKNKRKEVLRS